ncbi:MAG: sensor histidine kinase [Planctomycetota bacterium]|nr:MAG: sensor histidine kinase [Planctomycetota bacterium]
MTAAVAILLAVGLGAALWRSIAAPLEALERGIARIGAGDLAVEIGPIGDTELGRIARGVDAMTARLRERERALLRAERVGAIGRLAAGLAHQLNNPLGVMLGFARVLCDPRYGERERERAGAALIEEIETCRDTVRGLMTLVRPGAVAREPHELEPLLERAVAAARRYVDGKEVAIERRIEPDLRLETDATKFVQALRNVVTNAIEASEPGGRVVLEAARVGQEVCVAVEDEGPGVPEAERERIFEPYHTGKTSGTGLGLALARGLLEAMGGRLVCAPVRCGARFELWLPVGERAEQREGQR